jgi:hypothetical protein
MRFLWGALVLLMATAASAQNATEFNRIPTCNVAQLRTCIGGPEPGRTAWVFDGTSATDCSVGGGTNQHTCVQNADRSFSPAAGAGGGGGADGLGPPGAVGDVTVAGVFPAAQTATINAGAVVNADLAAGAVTTAKLSGGAVTTPIIANGAVTSLKLAAGSVNSTAIAANAVTTPAVAVDTVLTTSPTLASLHPSNTLTTPNFDNDPGVAIGAGKDANPSSGNMIGVISNGAFTNPDTNNLDPAFAIGSFNFNNANPDLPYSGGGWTTEYNWNAGQHSETNIAVEQYEQMNPNMFLVSFSGAGAAGNITAGQNWTFTNGAVCRPAGFGTSSVGAFGSTIANAKVHVFCVGSTPPANTNTITACTGPGCGGLTGTVSAVPVKDGSMRPEFFSYFPGINYSSFAFERSGSESGGSAATNYWMLADANNTLNLGHASDVSGVQTDTAPATVTTVATTAMGFCSVDGGGCHGTPLMQEAGDFGISTNQAGTYNVTNTVGGQIRYGTGQFLEESISPTKTQSCGSFTQLAAQTNVNLLCGNWDKTIAVAIGCRNDTSTAPAQELVVAQAAGVHTTAGTAVPMAGALTCAGKNSPIAFQLFSGSWNDQSQPNTLASGVGLRFDVGTAPTNLTDSFSFYVAFRDASR